MKSGQQKKKPKMRIWSMVLAFALAAVNILPMQTAEAAEMQIVYLNGEGGSNENSGQSSESAVSTLTKAKELLGESGGTIMVTGTLNVSWETTWSMPSGSVLKAAPGLEGPVIAVAKDGALTLNNIVIDGQKGNIISNSGYLSLKDNVTLQASGSRVSAEAAVYTSKEATTMKDGVLIAGVEKNEKETAASETTASETAATETTTGSSSPDTATTETTETTVQYPSTESESWQQDTPGQSESQAITTTPATEAPVPGASASQTEAEITETAPEDVITEAPAGNKNSPQAATKPETEPAESIKTTESTETTESTVMTESTEITESIETKESIETTETTEFAEFTDKNPGNKNKGAKTPGTEKADVKQVSDTTLPTEEPINNLDTFIEMVYSLQVESREDISSVVEVTKIYDALSDNERSQVSEDAYNLLIQAQNTAGVWNHAHNSVSVSGNLPWYVQFTAEINNSRDGGDNSKIIVPYDLKLWDMYHNTAYVLEQGEKVTVTMPVPDTDLSNGLTIYHYKSDGTTEVLHPVINGDTMSFETSSFSPFDVAGGTLLAGMGVNNSNNYTGGSTPSSTQTNNNSNSTSNHTPGNTSGNSTGSSTTNLKPQPAGNTLAASPNTGDATPIAVMVIGFVISGGAIFMMLRGKRKTQ